MTVKRRLPPVWLLGMTNATFGLTSGFVIVTLPEILAAQGVPGGHIAAITSIIVSPAFWAFLIAPMLDVRFSRRSYAMIFGLVAAIATAFVVMHHHNLTAVEVVMTGGYLAASLYQGAVGGWTGSLISREQASTLGIWFTVSNTGASGLTILFAASIIRHLNPVRRSINHRRSTSAAALAILLYPCTRPGPRPRPRNLRSLLARSGAPAPQAGSSHRARALRLSMCVLCPHQRPRRSRP